MDYPAEPVVSHHREKFLKKAWSPYEGELKNYMGKWLINTHRDERTGALSCVHSFQQAWLNAKKNRMALLTLAYAMPLPAAGCPPRPVHNDLMVTLVENPFGGEKKENASIPDQRPRG